MGMAWGYAACMQGRTDKMVLGFLWDTGHSMRWISLFMNLPTCTVQLYHNLPGGIGREDLPEPLRPGQYRFHSLDETV